MQALGQRLDLQIRRSYVNQAAKLFSGFTAWSDKKPTDRLLRVIVLRPQPREEQD
jgi:hypothetical protein